MRGLRLQSFRISLQHKWRSRPKQAISSDAIAIVPNNCQPILYRSCRFEQNILVTGIFFRTALGNQFLGGEQILVTVVCVA